MKRQRGSISIELIAIGLALAIGAGMWLRHDAKVRHEGVLKQQAADAKETARAAKVNEDKAKQGKKDAEDAKLKAERRRTAAESNLATARLARKAADEMRSRADPEYGACLTAPMCRGDAQRLRDYTEPRLPHPAGGDQLPRKPGVQGGPPPGFPVTPG